MLATDMMEPLGIFCISPSLVMAAGRHALPQAIPVFTSLAEYVSGAHNGCDVVNGYLQMCLRMTSCWNL